MGQHIQQNVVEGQSWNTACMLSRTFPWTIKVQKGLTAGRAQGEKGEGKKRERDEESASLPADR